MASIVGRILCRKCNAVLYTFDQLAIHDGDRILIVHPEVRPPILRLSTHSVSVQMRQRNPAVQRRQNDDDGNAACPFILFCKCVSAIFGAGISVRCLLQRLRREMRFLLLRPDLGNSIRRAKSQNHDGSFPRRLYRRAEQMGVATRLTRKQRRRATDAIRVPKKGHFHRVRKEE